MIGTVNIDKLSRRSQNELSYEPERILLEDSVIDPRILGK